jgi:hypothetical protein
LANKVHRSGKSVGAFAFEYFGAIRSRYQSL